MFFAAAGCRDAVVEMQALVWQQWPAALGARQAEAVVDHGRPQLAPPSRRSARSHALSHVLGLTFCLLSWKLSKVVLGPLRRCYAAAAIHDAAPLESLVTCP
jgi:hypothetical protein